MCCAAPALRTSGDALLTAPFARPEEPEKTEEELKRIEGLGIAQGIIEDVMKEMEKVIMEKEDIQWEIFEKIKIFFKISKWQKLSLNEH